MLDTECCATRAAHASPRPTRWKLKSCRRNQRIVRWPHALKGQPRKKTCAQNQRYVLPTDLEKRPGLRQQRRRRRHIRLGNWMTPCHPLPIPSQTTASHTKKNTTTKNETKRNEEIIPAPELNPSKIKQNHTRPH